MRKYAQLSQVKAGPTDGLAEGMFTGYASVFGNKDSYGDVVQPGAFTATLAAWKASGDVLPVYWGHDGGDPFSNIGGVIDAAEDPKGLLVTCQLDIEEMKAAKVYRLLKGRRVKQMSFAYDIVEGGPAKSETLGDYFSLDVLSLYEVSVVPIGANQETEILAVKHLAEAVKAGRVLSAVNESSLRDARGAIDSVLSALDAQDGKSAHPGGDNQGKTSGELEAKEVATTEEPNPAKVLVTTEEPKAGPTVEDLQAQLRLIAL